MSRQLLTMALAPLLGLFILGIGNGFLSTVITLRLDAAGESAVVIGWVSGLLHRPGPGRHAQRPPAVAHRPYPRLWKLRLPGGGHGAAAGAGGPPLGLVRAALHRRLGHGGGLPGDRELALDRRRPEGAWTTAGALHDLALCRRGARP